MGWSAGTEILSNMGKALNALMIESEDATSILVALIKELEDCDADTLDECMGESVELDAALEICGWKVSDDE